VVVDGIEISDRGSAAEVRHEEYRDDRFVAAIKLDRGQAARVFLPRARGDAGHLHRAVVAGRRHVSPAIARRGQVDAGDDHGGATLKCSFHISHRANRTTAVRCRIFPPPALRVRRGRLGGGELRVERLPSPRPASLASRHSAVRSPTLQPAAPFLRRKGGRGESPRATPDACFRRDGGYFPLLTTNITFTNSCMANHRCDLAACCWLGTVALLDIATARCFSRRSCRRPGAISSVVVLARDGSRLRAFADAAWRLALSGHAENGYRRCIVASAAGLRRPLVLEASRRESAWRCCARGGQVMGNRRSGVWWLHADDAGRAASSIPAKRAPGTRARRSASYGRSLRALQLEAHLSKHEILILYLERAPFGGTIEGVSRRPAGRIWASPPRGLSQAEAAHCSPYCRNRRADCRPDRSSRNRRPPGARQAAGAHDDAAACGHEPQVDDARIEGVVARQLQAAAQTRPCWRSDCAPPTRKPHVSLRRIDANRCNVRWKSASSSYFSEPATAYLSSPAGGR
jgi:hypothetical protein